MNDDSPLTSNPFLTLIHAHDNIWSDRLARDWRIRFATCTILWEAAIKVAKETAGIAERN